MGKDNKEKLTTIYVLVIVGILPLYFNNYYIDIVTVKKDLFIWSSLIYIALYMVITIKELMTSKKIQFAFRKQDVFMILFTFAMIVSTIVSKDFEASLLGTNGRGFGLLIYLLLFLLYLCISRSFRLQSIVIIVALLSGGVIALLAILNAFYLDPLGFFTRMTNIVYIESFYSTIGNVNFLVSYFSIVASLTIATYFITKQMILKYISYIASVLLLSACFLVNSEMAMIVVALQFLLSVIMMVKIERNVDDWAYLWISVLGIVKLMFLLIRNNYINVKPLSFLACTLMDSVVVYLLMALLIGLLVLNKFHSKLVKKIWNSRKQLTYGAIFLVCGIGIFLFINIGKIQALEIDNNRIDFWEKSLKGFAQFSVEEKLFGYGLELYNKFAINKLGWEYVNWDSAHNEFLQYLITAGIMGLSTYLLLVGNSIKEAAKKKETWIILGAVVNYLIISFSNMAQFVSTPIFFVLLFSLSAMSHLKKETG